MISALSKAITLYFASILALTSVILVLFAYLAPVFLLHDRVALVTVVPSTALVQPNNSSHKPDGPSIFLGLLGSCAKNSHSGDINCTTPTVSPHYDFSMLPSNAPDDLTPLSGSAPVLVALGIVFTIMFLISFTMISLRHKMGSKLEGLLDKPMLQRVSGFIGFASFLNGLTTFLIIRMWFGKAVDDFNASIVSQGQNGPQLIASTGNAFTMVWVAYAFYAAPVIASLTKLNVTATKQV